MWGRERVIEYICVYCVITSKHGCPRRLRLLPIVIICKSWHLLSTCYSKCVHERVCVFWIDPTVWQQWEDEDWSPKNTLGLGWLAGEERDRNRRFGGGAVTQQRNISRGGKGRKKWFTVEEGEIKREREAKTRREEVIEGDCFGVGVWGKIERQRREIGALGTWIHLPVWDKWL